jgi:hypothetical protein
MRNSLLQPQTFGVDNDSGIGDGGDMFGAAEDIYDVDGNGHVFEARIGLLAEDFGFVGIDRNDLVANALEVRRDFVGGTERIGGEADDGDGFGVAEQVGDGVVLHKVLMRESGNRVKVDVHVGQGGRIPQRLKPFCLRLNVKAPEARSELKLRPCKEEELCGTVGSKRNPSLRSG